MNNSSNNEKTFIVNAGKGGEYFVYNAESEKTEILKNTEETRRLLSEKTSFHIDEQKYENDICTFEKSIGTLAFINNKYRLYGYIYGKKNRITKEIVLTAKFFPIECIDTYKHILLNSFGNLIDISNAKLYFHCKIKGLYAGFEDSKGNAVMNDKVSHFLQCRLFLTEEKEKLQQENGFNQLADNEQHSNYGVLINKLSQLIDREQHLDKKEEQLNNKEQILLKKEQELHDKEVRLKIQEGEIEALKLLYADEQPEEGKLVRVDEIWPSKYIEYEWSDYSLECKLKQAFPNDVIRVPMSFYKKIVASIVKILYSSMDMTAYNAIMTIRFTGDKVRNILAAVDYDEKAEFVKIVILKKFTRFEVDRYDLNRYERQYREWRDEHRQFKPRED